MRPIEKIALAAVSGCEDRQSQADNLSEEVSALLRQIGSPGVAPDPESPFWAAAINSPRALSQFLQDYLARLLLPCELPAIVAARGHARRGELRELLAQDHRLAAALFETPFASPSRRMGWLHLSRLRPLRDERIVQRYLAAVESGCAHGWHTVVYGVTLAVYSLPLRQGLLHYSRETLSALAMGAARTADFPESELDETLSALFARLPDGVEAALAANRGSGLVANHRGELLPDV